MIEEEFLAIVKLVSGEEVISMICACNEETGIILILDNPITLKEQEIATGTLIRVQPWIKYSGESLHFIHIDKVITISEVTDKRIELLYNEYISKLNKSLTTRPSKSMGYVSTVEEFRNDLENIYKKS